MEITRNECKYDTLWHKDLKNLLQTRQKLDFGKQHVSRSLICTRFVTVAFLSEKAPRDLFWPKNNINFCKEP